MAVVKVAGCTWLVEAQPGHFQIPGEGRMASEQLN